MRVVRARGCITPHNRPYRMGDGCDMGAAGGEGEAE